MIWFYAFATAWAVIGTHFRYMAAREKAGKEGPWFYDFVTNGWRKADGPKGRFYVRATLCVTFVVPAVAFALVAIGGKLGWWG